MEGMVLLTFRAVEDGGEPEPRTSPVREPRTRPLLLDLQLSHLLGLSRQPSREVTGTRWTSVFLATCPRASLELSQAVAKGLGRACDVAGDGSRRSRNGRKAREGDFRGSLLLHTHDPVPPLSLSLWQPTGKLLSDGHPDQPQVYLERLELIRNACREETLRNLSHTEVSKFVLDRIFVCDKHRILFCQTPKVGNTQWKKVLIVLNGACGMGAGGGGRWHQRRLWFGLKRPTVFPKVPFKSWWWG